MRNTYKARFHPYKHKTNKINGYRISDELFEAGLDKIYQREVAVLITEDL